ncbi:MAG: MBL fold metallo-hydrolase [Opitutales bacterium]
MKLLDLNRDGGIGANSIYFELGPFRVLVDAGLNPKKAGYAAMPDFARIDDVELDFIVLTHCHLDHLGSLPVILRRHPEATVLMSVPSVSIAERMLHNSCNVMKRQKEEADIPEYPLFTHGEIDRIAKQFVSMGYNSPLVYESKGEKLEVTLFAAGHVAGASAVQMTYGKRKVFFTGDVLFETQRILKGARFHKGEIDTIVLETTRGGTERPAGQTRSSEVERLLQTINTTITQGGSCLIPVFALGRMQEILSLLRDGRKNGDLVKCPIFCAGLGMDLADYFDEISKKTGLLSFRRKVLKDLNVQPLPRHLKPGRDLPGSGIYVLSSGMLVENTPSYRVASCLLGHPNNSICYVGYCDPDTPGGKMLESRTAKEFLFSAFDFTAPMKAHIDRFELSCHADRDELIAFTLAASPRAVVLTHGDPPARVWFQETLRDLAPEIEVLDPDPGRMYDV